MWEKRPDRFLGRFRLSLANVISLVVGCAILLSVGTVLILSATTARQQLIDSLAGEFDLTISAIAAHVHQHLAAAEAQVDYLRAWMATDPQVADEDARLAAALRAALSASPQVTAIAFMRPDLTSVRIERHDPAPVWNDLSDRADLVAILRDAETRGRAGPTLGWSEPLYSRNIGQTIIVRREAVWSGERLLGVLFAATDLIALSQFSSDLSSEFGRTIFILHGNEEVIAHPNLLQTTDVLSADQPMLGIGEIGDTELAGIWSADREPVISQEEMVASEGHYRGVFGNWSVYVYTELTDFGATPWIVGFHFNTLSEGSEVDRFWLTLIVSTLLLVVFVVLGVILGRRLAAPIRRLTDRAVLVQRFDLNEISALPGSAIKELDDASSAVNAMIHSLQVSQRYIPKRLVEKFLRDGDAAATPQERAITIMFTDMAGFSHLAESMTPGETADLVNRYFEIIGGCIEDTNGTVDKYMGDGLLAFWGAPDRQDDHAMRACASAVAIREAVARENEVRSKAGKPSVRMRVGIHTGEAIVGDIGAKSRVNYTIVGDAVNVAARVESEGKLHPGGDVVILITEETRNAVGDRFATEAIGETKLPGRANPVTLFRIV